MSPIRLHSHDVQDSTAQLTANARLSSLLASDPQVSLDSSRKRYLVRTVVPQRGVVEARSSSLPTAIAGLTERIARLVLEVPSIAEWPAEWRQLLDESRIPSMQTPAQPTSVSRTKEKMPSIGVTSKCQLHQKLEELAEAEELPVAQVARRLFSDSVLKLNSRLHTENVESVLAEFQRAYEDLEGGESVRWMLRVERRLFNKSALLAKEVGKSQSQIAAWCLAKELSTCLAA